MADRAYEQTGQSQGWLAETQAFYDETLGWMREMRLGHPRAQDFEPTGHGGSDPTALAGTTPDRAVGDEKRFRWLADMIAVYTWEQVCLSRKYRNGQRPTRKDGDLDDIWCPLHAQFEVWNPIHKLGLCRPCYLRRRALAEMGLELTADEVRHHANPTNNGRWPKHYIDPKTGRVVAAPNPFKRRHYATTEALRAGAATLGVTPLLENGEDGTETKAS